MKKLVLKLEIFDDKAKQKAMKTVSTLPGIDSISMDMKEKKMTVIGTVDPVHVVSKLRKYWPSSDLITVGPEPEKKEEKKEGQKEEEKKPEELKKEDQKKEEEAKKEEPKKEEDKGKEEPKKEEEKKSSAPPPDPVLELVRAYRAYNPQMTSHYYVQSMEENPNSCAIC